MTDMVRKEGIEPSHFSVVDFESTASADSAICAKKTVCLFILVYILKFIIFAASTLKWWVA